jgi:glycosyltransferase involved in cell wall biosynthesis
MVNNKIIVFGNFGYKTNNLNGQTVKTRNVYELLKKRELEIGQVDFFETQNLNLFNFIKFIFSTKLFLCNSFVYLPALGSLKYLFPFLFILSKVFNFKIIQINVGGRHNEFLNKYPLHKFFLSKIAVNLPEMKKEFEELQSFFNFKNVEWCPNFRIHNYVPIIELNETNTFKICFMARITREKGVNTVIELGDFLNSNSCDIKSKVEIDFYGPIDDSNQEFVDSFFRNIESNNLLNYHGVLEPNDIHNVLNKYDVVVLPTFYPGEGFPGTVLDSFISGVPVIVSNWRHLPEFVKQGETGFLYDLNNNVAFFNYVKFLINNPKKVYKMKFNAFEESKNYSEQRVWAILKKHII